MVGGSVRGPLRLGEGSRLVECIVQGPVVVGDGAALERVTLGPGTAIGDRCRLSDAVISESIIFADVEIHDWRLTRSVIGRGSRVFGSGPPGYCELTLGDRSEVIAE